MRGVGLLLLLVAAAIWPFQLVAGDIGGPCGCKSCIEINNKSYNLTDEQGDRCGQGCLMATKDQGDDEICVCHTPINVTGGATAFAGSCPGPGPANEASPFLLGSGSGYTCDRNDWDQPHHCLCSPGQKVSKLYSVHDDWYEDREWTLECADIQPQYDVSDTSNWYSETTESSWDGVQDWNGIETNSFLVGMSSRHNNGYEDRKYKMYYTSSDNWVLSGCTDLQRMNYFDQPINHALGDDEVIARVYSYHNNGFEDREFWIVVCRLVKKCGELVSIEYDFDKAEETKNQGVFAGESIYDNTNGKNANTFTVEIQQTEQETLGDSYTYEKTSGYKNTASLSVKGGYSWGPIGPSFEATAGFSSTWSSSETWSRTQTQEYSEANSRKISYTATCGAGCYCKLTVTVSVAQAEIPYTMTTKSAGDDGDVCIEYGVMKAVRTFNAQAASLDTGC